MATCSVKGCKREAWAKGLCERDYFRERRGGDKPAAAPAERVEQHGTLSEYVNHKCRCASCRAANTEYQRGRRATAAGRVSA